MWIEFILNIIVTLLLAAAIIFAIRLQKQLRSFKENRQALEGTIAELIQATNSAQTAIEGLQCNADGLAGRLQKEIDEAQALFDELHFMNDAGNNLAQRLEKVAEKASKSVHGGAEPVSMTGNASNKKTEKPISESKGLRSKAEEDLLKALKEKKKL